ncbi:hypothetical protein U14_04408 [Candidatus Moduliflexus flocculans]|uniref:Uncharacterized protein n=1 Tax=Candidatus Moduliflexus flocculans TaxID=1499966 RepID=A0A0S6W476_9BACT|nr:hypothetical protein U14_04408 [Candidatus Moduliflexus flocculans]
MSTLAHITVSEFQRLLQESRLPDDTKISVIFEDQHIGIEMSKRQRAYDALQKLKGSGNGRLSATLLKDREQERWL